MSNITAVPVSAPSTLIFPLVYQPVFPLSPPAAPASKASLTVSGSPGCGLQTAESSREPLISSGQTDLADCGIVAITHNKQFIANRGGSCSPITSARPDEAATVRGQIFKQFKKLRLNNSRPPEVMGCT